MGACSVYIDGSEGDGDGSRREAVLREIVGEAPAFRKALADLELFSTQSQPVLITGETGTGKELVARAIHHLSRRCSHPFVAVNCGALPESLLEDDLFGHEPWSFTGAQHRRPGLIMRAETGTIFLDEIDSMPPKGQSTLLRVLEDKSVRPVGADEERAVDIRFIAATNAPIPRLIEKGLFRADLYYRLEAYMISLPALRERPEDILPLAHHFLCKHRKDDGPLSQLAAQAEAALLQHAWPGNVRELEHAIVRGIQNAPDGSIEAEHLKLPADGTAILVSYDEAKRRFEKEYLTRLMISERGNVTWAAEKAKIQRQVLQRLLRRNGILPESFRGRFR